MIQFELEIFNEFRFFTCMNCLKCEKPSQKRQFCEGAGQIRQEASYTNKGEVELAEEEEAYFGRANITMKNGSKKGLLKNK